MFDELVLEGAEEGVYRAQGELISDSNTLLAGAVTEFEVAADPDRAIVGKVHAIPGDAPGEPSACRFTIRNQGPTDFPALAVRYLQADAEQARSRRLATATLELLAGETHEETHPATAWSENAEGDHCVLLGPVSGPLANAGLCPVAGAEGPGGGGCRKRPRAGGAGGRAGIDGLVQRTGRPPRKRGRYWWGERPKPLACRNQPQGRDAMNSLFAMDSGTAPRWMRAVAFVVAVAFASLVLQPTAVAARDVLAGMDDTARSLPAGVGLPAALERTRQLLESVRAGLDSGVSTETAEAALADLRGRLHRLDRREMESFRALGRRLEERGYSPEVLARHEDTVRSYRAEMDALLGTLEALEKARTVADKRRVLRDMKFEAAQELTTYQLRKPNTPEPPLPHHSRQPAQDNLPRIDKEQFGRSRESPTAIGCLHSMTWRPRTRTAVAGRATSSARP
ncbi:MAG: hypothetical protein U5L11_17690 [Arhodomonas sp.]|nr:hypothetical protein [Arhodomonas sp.]